MNRYYPTVLSCPRTKNVTLLNLPRRKQRDLVPEYVHSTRRTTGTLIPKQLNAEYPVKASCRIWCGENSFRGSKRKTCNEKHMLTAVSPHLYIRTSSLLANQLIDKSCKTNDSLSDTFWKAVVASIVAVGSLGGIMLFVEPQRQKYLFYIKKGEGNCENLHQVGFGGGGNGGGGEPGSFATIAFLSASPTQKEASSYAHDMASEIEMTLHQPAPIQVSTAELQSASRPIYVKDEPFHFSKPYDISVRAVRGGRVTMEDEYYVADGGRFVAVFDGHGGGGVSQYLKNHLYEAVSHHVQLKHWEENDTQLHHPATNERMVNNQTFRPRRRGHYRDDTPSVFSYAAALKSAFSEIEENVLANDTLQFQGSTAVAVLIHESANVTGKGRKHRTLLSANIGDSRAILSRNGQAIELTRDHKPNDHQEKARILAMGETIEWDRVSKVHRVQNLSLSRAIGDRYAKPVVSGDVEINHYPLLSQSDEFILLASDGLWDVMTSDEVVTFVHERIRKELSNINVAKDDVDNFVLVLRRNMAKFVTREAIRRGSTDNVCVVMVWLDEMD